MSEVADNFGILLPEFLNFELVIESIGIDYLSDENKIVFDGDIRHFGHLLLEAWKSPNKPADSYKLALDFDRKLELTSIPIIGRFCNPEDGFIFKGLNLSYTENVEFKFTFLAQLVIKQLAVNLDIDYIQSLKNKLALPQLPGNASELPTNTIHWLDIHKGFGVLYFSKIGVSLIESELTLYLDASFTISFIRLDFLNLTCRLL